MIRSCIRILSHVQKPSALPLDGPRSAHCTGWLPCRGSGDAAREAVQEPVTDGVREGSGHHSFSSKYGGANRRTGGTRCSQQSKDMDY